MRITFNVQPANSAPQQTSDASLAVDITYSRNVPAQDEQPEGTVTEAVRLQLDPQLRGSTILEDVAGTSIKADILAVDGSLILSRTVAPNNGNAALILTDADVALCRNSQQQIPTDGPRPVNNRVVKLVPTNDVKVDYARSAVMVTVFPSQSAVDQSGLNAILNIDVTRASSVDVRTLDLDPLTHLTWSAAHLAVDGTFSCTLTEQPSVGWLWWLTGDQQVIGFIPDSLSPSSNSELAVALPALQVRSIDVAVVSNDCQCDKLVPSDVTETEVANNPGVYTEDPGAFCKPFSNPERVLSEKSFAVIARIQSPQISAAGSINSASLDLMGEEERKETQGFLTTILNGLFGAQQSLTRPTGRTPRRTRPDRQLEEFLRSLRSGRRTMDAAHPIQWEDDVAQYQATTVSLGHVLEYRIRWRSNGYSLGKVARTLTLAPRQARRIQKIEWERSERARRREQTSLRDVENDSTTRERDYQDEVAANLSEWSKGGSSSDTEAVAGGIGFFAPPVAGGAGGGAAAAHSSSHQEGGRSTAASEHQRLRDAIRRHGDALRKFESTVVNEVNEEENLTGTTEVIRNLNYAHSLTVIYYQILRHLRVDTEFAGVRECLFVPFAIKAFDLARAYRWRAAIQSAIRSRRYLRALRYLKDVSNNFATSDIPPGTRASQRITYLRGSIFINLAIDRPKDAIDGTYDDAQWGPFKHLLGTPALGIFEQLAQRVGFDRDRHFQSNFASSVAAKWANSLMLTIGNRPIEIDSTMATRYQFNRGARIDFVVPTQALAGLNREQLQHVRLTPVNHLPAGSVANLTRMTFTYTTERFERSIDARTNINDLIMPATGFAAEAQLNFPLDAWESVDERAEISRSVEELVEHLNEHVEYYHKAIWWRMDRDRLFMMLDGFYAPNTNGVSIASLVDREPLGVIGNCLVYRVGAASYIGYGQIDSPQKLYDLYAEKTPVRDPVLVSLPTDGLYAQTIMDECLALEEHFGSLDWALNDKDPELGSLDPSLLTSRRSDPSATLAPTPLPATIINLQNAPDAPAPSGLQGVLNAATNAGAFRDMAGLAGTQSNAQAALSTAAGLATSFGQGAASLASAELASKIHATSTADQKLSSIKRAESLKLIDPATAASQAGEVLREMHTPRSAVKPYQEQSIISAMQSATGIEGSVIEASTTEGQVRVALGGPRGTRATPEKSQLAALLGFALEKTSEALMEGLRKARSNPDGKLEAALRKALLEAAKKELIKQGVSAVEKLPVGKALVLGTKLALAFSAGVGLKLQEVNERLRARYNDLERATDFGTDGLTEEQIEMLGALRSFQLTAVQELPSIVRAGMDNVILKARDLAIEAAGDAFSESLSSITVELSNNDEVIGLIASGVQKRLGDIPEERLKVEAFLLKLVVNGFIKQLDDGRLKTALETAIKPVKGDNPIIAELFGGVIAAIVELETTDLKTQLGSAFPEVKALLTKKAVELKAVYDADGTLRIVASAGDEVKIAPKEVTAPSAVIAEIETAAGNPPKEIVELLALADQFVSLKQVEATRLKAAIYGLQRRVTSDSSAFKRLETAADFENTRTMHQIATAFTELIARVQERMRFPDPQRAEAFLTDPNGPLNSVAYDLNDRATFYHLDGSGSQGEPFPRPHDARAFVARRSSQGIDL